jgi:hypothetical protein
MQGWVSMAEKKYILRRRFSERRLHMVIAAGFEVHCDHLVFLNSRGELLFLFLLDTVESWNEI